MIINGKWRQLPRLSVPEAAVEAVDQVLETLAAGLHVLITSADVFANMRAGYFVDRVGFLEKEARKAGFDAKSVDIEVAVSKTGGKAIIPLSALAETRSSMMDGQATLARDLGYRITDDASMAVLQKLIERTDMEVERLRREGVKIANAGQHFGRIESVGEGMIIQDAGQGRRVAHRASSLDAIPVPGQMMDIKYQGNGLATVKGADRGPEVGHSR